MTPLQAFILGIVEGVTEYLPVSSTGHLILTSWLLGLGDTPERKDAIDAFEIIIQAGAILAVVGLYRRDLLAMVRGTLWRVKLLRESAPEVSASTRVDVLTRMTAGMRGDAPVTLQEGWTLARNVVVAFLPALALGVLLAKAIKGALFHPWPVIGALAVGGALMLWIAPWQKRQRAQERAGMPPRLTLASMTIPHALIIGTLQCVAMWPGTSRSLMTILAGLLIGLRPMQAAKFSFLLGLVTLCAASTKETLDIVRAGHMDHFVQMIGGWLPLLMGIVAAWASAALAVDLFVTYLGRHTLAIFGWWRLLLAAACAAYLFLSPTTPTIAP